MESNQHPTRHIRECLKEVGEDIYFAPLSVIPGQVVLLNRRERELRASIARHPTSYGKE